MEGLFLAGEVDIAGRRLFEAGVAFGGVVEGLVLLPLKSTCASEKIEEIVC